MVSAMRHRVVARSNLEPRGIAVDQETGDLLLAAPVGLFYAGRNEYDAEIRDIGVADEMLGAVDDPVIAIRFRLTLHAANVRACIRLGHRQRIEFLTADDRRQVFFALLTFTGDQDAGGTAEIDRETH